jgi:hypothetical protein
MKRLPFFVELCKFITLATESAIRSLTKSVQFSSYPRNLFLSQTAILDLFNKKHLEISAVSTGSPEPSWPNVRDA